MLNCHTSFWMCPTTSVCTITTLHNFILCLGFTSVCFPEQQDSVLLSKKSGRQKKGPQHIMEYLNFPVLPLCFFIPSSLNAQREGSSLLSPEAIM